MGSRTRNSSDLRGPSLDARIVAASRHGVVERNTLIELGLTWDDVGYRERNGRLHRLYKGVYAVGRPDLPLDGVFLAAVLACGPEAVLSHRTAARKHALLAGGTYRIDVTAPRSVKRKDGIRLHRPLSVDARDTTVADAIPITTVARTLLDCADPVLRVDIGAMLHEAASVQRNLDMREIWAVLARSPNHRGARRLDWAAREEHPLVRSGLERAMIALLARFGVPAAEVNQHVWNGEALVEVDFFWRHAGVIVETDGGRYHASRWRRRKDAEKTARLRAAGFVVHRFSDTEVAGAADRIAAIIRAELKTSRHRPPYSE